MNQTLPNIGYCFNPGCQEPHHQDGTLVCPSCGSSLWLVNRYRAVRRLGQGGMSQTFLALDYADTPPTRCVVKQVEGPPHSYPVELLQSLVQEGWNDPHLPRWLAQFEQDEVYYRVQEYIAGENLATVLAETGTFNASDIWQLLEQLLPAIQQLHHRGITHGDIKPENIICRESPEPSPQSGRLDDLVLVDLGTTTGLSPVPSSISVPPPLAIGSPVYAAPEQLNGNPGFASDLYSLGVTCIYLLTGIHPFSLFDSVEQQWIWRNYRLSDPLEWAEQALAQFLDRLIAPDLKQRISSAEIAIAAMQTLRGKRIEPIPMPVRLLPWTCYATLTGHSGLFANINAVAIAPDGSLVASASDDKTIRLWDLQTGQERFILRGHTHFVKSVAFHPHNPTWLVSGGRDRTIYVWDLQTQRIVQTLPGHEHTVNVVRFSPDGDLLASGSADKTVNLWDARTGEILAALQGHTLAVTDLAFATRCFNGEHQPILASASVDSTVRLWDLTTGEALYTLSDHTAAVRAIAFSPDGTWLATGSEDRTIRLWDVASRQCRRILTGHPWTVSALMFTADGNTLISGSWDKTVKVWQVDSGETIATLTGHTDSVSCGAIAPNQHRIVSGSYDQTIKLWQLNRNQGS